MGCPNDIYVIAFTQSAKHTNKMSNMENEIIRQLGQKVASTKGRTNKQNNTYTLSKWQTPRSRCPTLKKGGATRYSHKGQKHESLITNWTVDRPENGHEFG